MEGPSPPRPLIRHYGLGLRKGHRVQANSYPRVSQPVGEMKRKVIKSRTSFGEKETPS